MTYRCHTDMAQTHFVKAEHEFKRGQEYPETSTADKSERTRSRLVTDEWDRSVPGLRARADKEGITEERYRTDIAWSWKLAEIIFEALHQNWSHAKKGEEPHYFWHHQEFSMFRLHDFTRGIGVDKEDLSKAAATYLRYPEARTDRMDWVLLDSLVLTELEAFAAQVFEARGGMAATIAPREPAKYAVLRAVFWLLGVSFNVVAWPGLSVYLFLKEHPIWAAIVGGLWVVWLIALLVTWPKRWRARRKVSKLLDHLMTLYRLLGENTISPRKLKEALDTAAADGVVVDGAVFTLVDRIIARDPTAFIPGKWW